MTLLLPRGVNRRTGLGGWSRLTPREGSEQKQLRKLAVEISTALRRPPLYCISSQLSPGVTECVETTVHSLGKLIGIVGIPTNRSAGVGNESLPNSNSRLLDSS